MLNPSRIGRENWLDELGSMNNEREIELDEYISCVRKKMATSMEVGLFDSRESEAEE